MSYRGQPDIAFFQVGGYNLNPYLLRSEFDKSAVLEQSDTFGDTWREHTDVGTRAFDLSQQGFYDDEADGINQVLLANLGVGKVVSLAMAGNVAGRAFVGFEGPFLAAYRRLVSREGLHKANAVYRGHGRLEEGVILQKRQVLTGDANTEGAESVDHGASSANGGAAYLQVEDLALGTHTGLSVAVRHSADDSTYATLLTFTTVTTARTAERKTVAGTVNRHLAVSHDFTGAGSPTATVSVGFARF